MELTRRHFRQYPRISPGCTAAASAAWVARGPPTPKPVLGLSTIIGNHVVKEEMRLAQSAGGFISENMRRAHTKQAFLSYKLGTFPKLRGGERKR